jgi:hypothetical protein
MADDKAGRDEQAQNKSRRQRERALEEELERGGEPEPAMPSAATDALDDLSYPVTGEDLVDAVGNRVVEAGTETVPIADLLPATDREVFESPTPVRNRVRYPGVARAMKRIVETADPRLAEPLRGSQRDAYEKTLRALADIDALDDDAVVRELTEWITASVAESGSFPGSRSIRRQAAKIARSHGYEVGNDDWLGV